MGNFKGVTILAVELAERKTTRGPLSEAEGTERLADDADKKRDIQMDSPFPR